MKIGKRFGSIRISPLLLLAGVLSGAPPIAQEKPEIILIRQDTARFRESRDTSALLPGTAPYAPKLKSENTAYHWSLYGTLAPIGASIVIGASHIDKQGTSIIILLGSGLIFGPSLGYFYGGRPGRGLTGAGIRVGLAAATAVATAQAAEATKDEFLNFSAFGVFSLGLAAVTVSSIVDIKHVKAAVRKHNRSLLEKREKMLSITPAYFAQHGAPGLNMQVQF